MDYLLENFSLAIGNSILFYLFCPDIFTLGSGRPRIAPYYCKFPFSGQDGYVTSFWQSPTQLGTTLRIFHCYSDSTYLLFTRGGHQWLTGRPPRQIFDGYRSFITPALLSWLRKTPQCVGGVSPFYLFASLQLSSCTSIFWLCNGSDVSCFMQRSFIGNFHEILPSVVLPPSEKGAYLAQRLILL